MAKILIVDDEASIRRTLRDILEYEKYEVDETKDGMECLVKLKKEKYDVVIMDIKMPKMDGIEALERIQLIAPDIPVIMISGHANIDSAVEAVKKGAFDFISKPPDLNRMLITIRNAMDKASLVIEKKVLQRKVAKSKTQEIIGESEAITKINETIERVAPTEARVLITGKNGTGKELVARWIHEKSPRAEYPIIEVNCAAIPAELIESELFGHEKGAFTSAVKQRIGKFEQANGGTLFLDEIGDMSLSAQAKVLRALQENKITRVGGEKSITVNVRVIAATNKDLRSEIRKGKFREDLYHRLAVIIVNVPTLNDRKDDIPLLVDHFNDMICDEYGVPKKKFKKEAMTTLQEIDWSGNIRELRNVVERLIILSADTVSKADVLNYVVPSSRGKGSVPFPNIFEKFDNVDELHDFINQAYSKYKSDVKV
ncbi:MAG: sigma-54 dependent transcriptional regulator [Saprospiraceae bacterium]|nr:sigma-54 dependent transcriptional regulator [Saprospiraceae bacterium]